MGRDVDDNLVETEFKGSVNDGTQLPTNAAGQKQLSKKNNAKRARKMRRKVGKINKPSNRIGGPYHQNEIDLWQLIKDLDGEKNLMSTHTNVDTGEVRVFNRDSEGFITELIDNFNVYKD